MEHTIEFEKDAKYVSVVLTGEVTKNELEAARNEANLVLTANGCDRLLVDTTRSKPSLSIVERFEFASEHPSSFPPNIRIALFGRPDELMNHQFTENVARNRGVDMNVFLDGDRALNWLLERS